MESYLSIRKAHFPFVKPAFHCYLVTPLQRGSIAMAPTRLSPPDAARRRFVFRHLAILAAFAAAVLAAGEFLPRVEEPPLRWLLAAAPIAVLALWGWEFYKMVRDDDEMMRALHLRVTAISGMLVLLGGTMWGVLERLMGVPVLPTYLLLPVYAVVSGVIMAFLARRS
jgi:hypothetical protein